MTETSDPNAARHPKSLDRGEPVHLEGRIERIVYENPDNGFFVGRLHVEGYGELVTFVGNLMAVSPGETIRLDGHWVEDKRFGRQVLTESYETILPSTVAGIEKYLGSGLIHGIGKVYAKRLIDAFGAETLRVIDKSPHRLTSVEGIGRKRATQIRTAWEEQKSIQSIMIFLQGHGIGTAQAVRIYKRYGDGAVAVLRDNPYRLSQDITGIGFAGADKIAASLGIEKDSPKRLEAGLVHILLQARNEGHVFLNEDDLMEKTANLLEVDANLTPPALQSLVSAGTVIKEDGHIFMVDLHAAEMECGHHLKRLLSNPKGDLTIQTDKALEWVQNKEDIELSNEQQEALARAFDSHVLVVTGGPGTGKTTLINCIIAIFEKKGLSTLLAAPTGRAAKRMENATKHEAKTIHRLLEFSPREGGFTRDSNNPLTSDVIIIDECSMVDIQLMEGLLCAIPSEARLVLVGDVDQLPSVGPGNVLLDIIASGVVPVVRLKTIFRQAAQSGIITNAHRINRGEPPQFNSTDCFFIERKEPGDVLETVVELVSKRIPSRFGYDPFRDVQVLSPMHRGEAGVAKLNNALQHALNAQGAPIEKRHFRHNDKVIQMRNNYDLDVFNGDLGVITLVDEEARELEVKFDDRTALYSFTDLDDLALAYAITVHKSQGSEYPVVVLPLLPQHYMLLQRNVLYTAITRARSLLIVIGHPKALQMALANTDVTRRNTALAERLRNEL